MEHTRTLTHQFCDTTKYIILDSHTGKPFKHPAQGVTFTLEDALDILSGQSHGWIYRHVIVKIECIKGFQLN